MYDISKRNYDKNKGLQKNDFANVLNRVICSDDELGEGGVRKNKGTDIADPYGSSVKPKNVPVWTTPPLSAQDEAIYYGNHIHSESNPLGLHTHVKGGKLSGGHTHGPQNRFGSHHHKDTENFLFGISLDGSHVHDGENYPKGCHEHCPENFG